ncbi:MAG: hypothetical protein CVU39_14890 [Chloroflexi bacterium HGW-Chloroflexi-10]|nr:MAG: hypothetical protein CVU39_14890 [Chloroflexi bacterium HGW-Chloroflexi-10]
MLSCKLSERIAAIGSVSGAYLLAWEDCNPAHPVPAILFHGTNDPIVPYQGGPSRAFNHPFPYIPDWASTLAAHNGCGSLPREITPAGAVTGKTYLNCNQNAEVTFYTISGGGHSWPGGDPLPPWIVGATTQEIDATRLMWAFFEGHPKP